MISPSARRLLGPSFLRWSHLPARRAEAAQGPAGTALGTRSAKFDTYAESSRRWLEGAAGRRGRDVSIGASNGSSVTGNDATTFARSSALCEPRSRGLRRATHRRTLHCRIPPEHVRLSRVASRRHRYRVQLGTQRRLVTDFQPIGHHDIRATRDDLEEHGALSVDREGGAGEMGAREGRPRLAAPGLAMPAPLAGRSPRSSRNVARPVAGIPAARRRRVSGSRRMPFRRADESPYAAPSRCRTIRKKVV